MTWKTHTNELSCARQAQVDHETNRNNTKKIINSLKNTLEHWLATWNIAVHLNVEKRFWGASQSNFEQLGYLESLVYQAASSSSLSLKGGKVFEGKWLRNRLRADENESRSLLAVDIQGHQRGGVRIRLLT